MVAAETACKRKAEGGRESRGQARGGRKRFEGGKVGVEDEGGSGSSRRDSRLQNGNKMESCGRERAVGSEEGSRSRERKAV
jgi:hypothetical protein